MNTYWSRWRIAALVIFIAALAMAIPVGMKIYRTLTVPKDVQSVTIRQLINGEVPAGKFVSVHAQARYSVAQAQTKNGKRIAIFYPLIDWNDQTLIYVRSTDLTLFSLIDGMQTVTGTIEPSSEDLKSLVKQDMADIQSAGILPTDSIYIQEAPQPGDVKVLWIEAGGLLLVAVLSLVGFFLPLRRRAGK